MDIEEITKKEGDFLIHTNNFYYNVEEFCEIHEADKEEFQRLLE